MGLSPLQVEGLRAEGGARWIDALSVSTEARLRDPSLPEVAGRRDLDERGLHFRPAFAFVPGLAYVARFEFDGLVLERRFSLPAAAPADAPRVLGVFPSRRRLPENTLRLYVHFDQPMQARDVARHVSLRTDAGEVVQLAFVEIPDGLWDPGGTRLTLLLHPGRIKRGVGPGEQLGPPLRAGGAYRLRLDSQLRSAAGAPLGTAFEHVFEVAAADREAPDARGLRVTPPGDAGGALTLHAPEPLDHALLRRWVWVEDEAGRVLEGDLSVEAEETRWVFRPARPWSPGRYEVRVHRALEDNAGNRFDRLFDRDAGSPLGEDAPEPLSLPFELLFRNE